MTKQKTLADLRESAAALIGHSDPRSTAQLLYQLIVRLHENEQAKLRNEAQTSA